MAIRAAKSELLRLLVVPDTFARDPARPACAWPISLPLAHAEPPFVPVRDRIPRRSPPARPRCWRMPSGNPAIRVTDPAKALDYFTVRTIADLLREGRP